MNKGAMNAPFLFSVAHLTIHNPCIAFPSTVLRYLATNELGISQAALSKRLELSQSAVSIAAAQGRELVRKHNYRI